jgi:hypothetical protein
MLGQIILIFVLIIFGVYVFRIRTVLTDRIILLLLACGGLVLVIQPDFSTWIANRVGIGRGTDLILYVFILFSLFYFVGISSDLKKIERQLTEVVRAQALQNPQFGNDSSGSASGLTSPGVDEVHDNAEQQPPERP